MKRTITVALLLVALVAAYWIAQAGDLEPPGPPAPTMVTLQQIYDKLDECCTGGGPCDCGVPKTGQTNCWDASGTPINCAGTGQDGDYQAGFSVDPRFTDNGDGTVTDNLTGLIWLKDANCFGSQSWTQALSDANTSADGSCGLTDGSVAGDWRLPNVRELQSLIDYGHFLPALPSGHPFSAVRSSEYWSSTTAPEVLSAAFYVSFGNGYVDHDDNKTGPFYVWPVRGGV